ncbi:hypothetical protein R69608_07176 [Paraburkholderia nemoris]|nr:hypothetical protein R69608_07176 [Paraburkholderia nemoris]
MIAKLPTAITDTMAASMCATAPSLGVQQNPCTRWSLTRFRKTSGCDLFFYIRLS